MSNRFKKGVAAEFAPMQKELTVSCLALLFFGCSVIALAASVSADSGRCLYLRPYNLHLSMGKTSRKPLRIYNAGGKRVPGPVTIYHEDTLLSIDSKGYVTPRKKEREGQIGEWVGAHINGDWAHNWSIVRVLSKDYGLKFKEISSKNVTLYFPKSVPNSYVADIVPWVKQQQMLKILEYSYRLMSEMMMLRPFEGCRQIFEVDMGEGESSRVCGINGNPIRLGWNITGESLNNCFILNEDTPQWGVILHEMGHNFTLPSTVYRRGLLPGRGWDDFMYTEHGAQVLSWVVMQIASENLALNATASRALPEVNLYEQNIERQYFEEWVQRGARHHGMGSPEVNTIWMDFMNEYGEKFAWRYFYLLAPHHEDRLDRILNKVERSGGKGRHSFFAALVSAAANENLYKRLKKKYHFKMKKALYKDARDVMKNLLKEEFVARQSSTKESVPYPASNWEGCSLRR